jgi:hypothetical protein
MNSTYGFSTYDLYSRKHRDTTALGKNHGQCSLFSHGICYSFLVCHPRPAIGPHFCFCRWILSNSDYRSWIYRVIYYKRNRQFQHFITPKLFMISTLTMHGFVDKLWKFYHCSPWWPHWHREIINYFDANLPQCWTGRATGDNMSLTCWPPRNPDVTGCDPFYRDMSQARSSSLPFLLL